MSVPLVNQMPRVKGNPLVIKGIQIILASFLIGLCAQIKIPLYFTPVPLTGQTFGITLIAMFLGGKKGALATICYLIEGALGLPVFAGGSAGIHPFMGVMGGYLFSFVLQAFLVGWFLEKRKSFHYVKTAGIIFLISCLQLALGAIWLGAYIGFDRMMLCGFYPFIPGAAIKTLLATHYLFTKQKRSQT